MRAELYVEEQYRDLERLFATELARQHARSNVEIEKDGEGTRFTITAEDISAMRAAFNSITSILRVWEDSR